MKALNKIEVNEKQVLTIVLLECIIFPWLFLSYSAIACLVVFGIYLFTRFVLKNNLSILIILNLFYLCPIEISFVDISAQMFWIYLIVRLCYLLELILVYKYIRKNSFFIKILLIFPFLCIYDALINTSAVPLIEWPQEMLYLIVPFFVILKLDFRSEFLYKYGDVVFVVSFIYLIGQWIGIYPYESLREQQLEAITWVEDFVRLGGLTCNSLCLTVVLLFEAVSIWSRLLLYGRINYILLSMLILALLLTVSKTAVLGFLIISLFGLYVLLKYQKRLNLFFLLVFAFVGIVILMNNIFTELFSDNLTRLLNARNELGHRFSAFKGVYNIFIDNPLGVGDRLNMLLDTKYRTFGWIVGFSTLDNFFLTQIGKFGIFSVLYIMLYTYGFFYALRYRKKNKIAFQCLCMLYLCIAFVSFSFNWEAFVSILSFVCLFSALYIKILQKGIVNGIVVRK